MTLSISAFAFGAKPVKESPLAPISDHYLPCSEEIFWKAVCMAESGCNPKSVYMEPPPLRYESLGLFQTSIQDHAGYPECSPIRAVHLTAEGSTICKDAIVKKLRAKYPNLNWAQVLSKYWSVLRSETYYHKTYSGYARFKHFAEQKGCVIGLR